MANDWVELIAYIAGLIFAGFVFWVLFGRR